MKDALTYTEMVKAFPQLKKGRVQAMVRAGIVCPRGGPCPGRGSSRLYSAADIVRLIVSHELVERMGIPLDKLKKILW